jgi:hypothetical protein
MKFIIPVEFTIEAKSMNEAKTQAIIAQKQLNGTLAKSVLRTQGIMMEEAKVGEPNEKR